MKKLTTFSLLLLAIVACKKEPTSWNSSWTAPLVHGRLTLEDLLPPENLSTNSEGYLSIIYNEPVYAFSIDTLIELPDTTIVQKTAVNFGSLTVNPGFSYGDNYDQQYDLDDIELKRVIVKEGKIEMTIRSPWPGKAFVTFDFPTITEPGGASFVRTFYVDAGSQANPATASDVIDISGFDLDMTGISGNLINTISGDIIVGSNETTDSYNVSNSDSIQYEITFKELIPDYAKGYFGSYSITDTTGFDLPFMDGLLGGSIDIDSIDLKIIVKNGFNLIAQAKISQVLGLNSNTSSSSSLNFPLLNNSININPASGGLYDYVPSEYVIPINNQNSNITQFIENLSDSIYLGYQIDINPNGNVTAGSDELFPGSELELIVDGEFPLLFGADQLMLADTFDISYNTNETVVPQEATMTIAYENAFPLEAAAKLYLLDQDGVVIDSILSDQQIEPGVYDDITGLTSTTSGSVSYTLSRAQIVSLEIADKLSVLLDFSTATANKVKINSTAFFDFKLRSNLNIDIHL